MKKKIKNNPSAFLIGLLVLLSAISLWSCSNQRVRDRFDEDVLNRQEDHYNLFFQSVDFPTGRRIPSHPVEEKMQEESTAYYRMSLLKGLEPVRLQTLENMAEYSAISICWNDGPPVLRFYQRLFNEKRMEFTAPVDKSNSRLVSEKDGVAEYEMIVALRQGTMFPWFQMDDYEIFKLQLLCHQASGQWEIKQVKMLTDNRIEDIQPVYSHDYAHIAFVRVDEEQPSLWLMNPDGSGQKMISEQASMPYFLPNSPLMIFVRRSDEGMDFFVYNRQDGTLRPAERSEVEASFRFIPYARLKENYLMVDNFRRDKDIPSREFTYRSALFYGLKNGPEVLRDYYNYQSAQAGAVEYLYDIGPDFMGNSYYSAYNNLFVHDKGYSEVGDHISQQDFLRLIGGLSVPVIPNIPLRKSTYAHERWNAEASRCQFHKTVNDYMGNLATVFFDYAEHQDCMAEYRRMYQVSRQRLKEIHYQEQNDYNTRERLLFAKSFLAGVESEMDNEAEGLIASQLKLSAMLGLNTDRELSMSLRRAEDMMPAFETDLPSLEWFQSLGQVNHPDIQRANYMILVASAVRDMGPVSTRTNGVSISASYGFGLAQWSNAVDDFLLLGASYMQPLRLPKVYQSYYDNWSAKIDSLRQEKYRLQGSVKMDIHSAYKILLQHRNSIKTLNDRVNLYAERLRISNIYEDIGEMSFQQDQLKSQLSGYNDIYGNTLAYYSEKLRLIRERYEYMRQLTRLYAASGTSVRLVPALLRYSDPEKPLAEAQSRGIFLWKSLEVVTSRENRNKFIELCRARNIDKVYCFVSRTKEKELYLDRYNLEFAYFTQLCSRNGISVYALMGEPDWITRGYRLEINALLDSYKRFNRNVEAGGGVPFAGMNLDVEPHALPEWQKDKVSLCRDYLSMLHYVSAVVGKNNLSVDVSYNYNGLMLDKDHDLLYYISREAGRIAVMAYYNKPEKVREKMLPILQRQDLECGIETALETAPLEEKYLTFYGKTYGDLQAVCRELQKDFSGFTRFQGFIFNDYENYKHMK